MNTKLQQRDSLVQARSLWGTVRAALLWSDTATRLSILSLLSACAQSPGTEPLVIDPASPPVLLRCARRGVTPACTGQVRDTDAILLKADILKPEGIVVDGEMLIRNGRIECIGCDCANPDANIVDCSGFLAGPGLIDGVGNVSLFAPGLPAPEFDTSTRYGWWFDQDELLHEAPAGPYAGTLAAVHHMLRGTTTMSGNSGSANMIRNLRFASTSLGLLDRDLLYHEFPLRRVDGEPPVDCGYSNALPPERLMSVHRAVFVADVGSAEDSEIGCLGELGLITPKSVVAFASRLSDSQLGLLERSGAGFVWSPSLSRATDSVPLGTEGWPRGSLRWAFGTHWSVQGFTAVIDEATCLLDEDATAGMSPQRLFHALTLGAADVLGLTGLSGELSVGAHADIVVLPRLERHDYAQILRGYSSARPQLVVIEGEIRLVQTESWDGTDACYNMTSCGHGYSVCASTYTLSELERTELRGLNLDALLCGTPPKIGACVKP